LEGNDIERWWSERSTKSQGRADAAASFNDDVTSLTAEASFNLIREDIS
jgi:hypothetical protein